MDCRLCSDGLGHISLICQFKGLQGFPHLFGSLPQLWMTACLLNFLITPEDTKIVQDLVKKYPKQIPVLLRQMRDNPELAQKFIREATQTESEDQ